MRLSLNNTHAVKVFCDMRFNVSLAEDEGLKQSLMKYAIESGAITERVYRNEMEAPIEDMKRFLDGILHIYDEGRTKVPMGELFGIVTAAEERLTEKKNSVAP